MSTLPQSQLDCWQKMLNLLRAEVGDYSYSTWFQPLKLHSLENGRMALTVQDRFMQQVILSRHRLLLQRAALAAYGREFEVDILHEGDILIAPNAVSGDAAMLNPKYTFETFVVGDGNRFGHAASFAVAETPSDAYNPLFLYGGAGLGKTHLMHAIGHYILHNAPQTKVMYITSENFTNQLITAIRKETNQEFRDKLRYVDVLMVDDIQFIAGKPGTQEEFFHTFNELHGKGKQVIIASDRPPKEITALEERLRSRFEWGLIADLQMPNRETREAILQRKAELEGVEVEGAVLHMIAERIESNIRELEGTLTRLTAKAAVERVTLDLAFAERELSAMTGGKGRGAKRVISADAIIEAVCAHYKITKADILSPRRNREFALPRQVAMYLTRELTPLSTTRIGEHFGGRDHTTVMHACEKIAAGIKEDAKLREAVVELKERIVKR